MWFLHNIKKKKSSLPLMLDLADFQCLSALPLWMDEMVALTMCSGGHVQPSGSTWSRLCQ